MKEGHWALAGLGGRLILGFVFAATGLQKAAAPPEEFAAIVETYRLLPHGFVLSFAMIVPWVQLLIGLSLIAGYFTRFSAVGIGALLLAFIGALSSTMVRGISLPDCGCYGSFLHLQPGHAIVLDIFFLGLATLAFKRGAALFSLDQWIGGGSKKV